jgi:asparagine N-glycosylation enzyme membrane subunit Stt3
MNILGGLKKHYWIFLLLLIFVAAWYIRYIPGTKFVYPQMLEIDTHFFLRMGEYILANGNVPQHDVMAAWNTIPGGPNRQTDFLVVIWIYPIFYYLLHPIFGWSMYWVGVWVPAFIGALHVFFMYFLGKEIFNSKKVGLLSAAFLAFAPGILYRVSAGFMEKEPPAGLFMVIALYFFVRSFKEQEIAKEWNWKFVILHPLSVMDRLKFEPEKIKIMKSIGYGIISGFFFSLMGGSSGLVEIPLLAIALSVMISLFLNKNFKVLLYSQPSMFISYTLISKIFAVSPVYSFISIEVVTNFIALAFLLILYGTEKSGLVSEKNVKFVIPAVICMGILAAAVGSYMFVDFGDWVGLNIQRISNPISAGLISSTVAEAQGVGDFFRQSTLNYGNEYAINVFQLPGFLIYLSAIYFAFLGIALMCYEFVFKKRNFEYMLVVTMFICFMILAIGAARLAFVFGFVESIAAAYFIVKGGSYVLAYGNKHLNENKQIYLKFAGVALVVVIVFTNFAASYVMAQNITSSLTDDWRQAFDWIRTNTPQDSITLEWWDFGWWFEYIAQRRTLVDGGYHPAQPTRDIAKFYTEPFTDDASPSSDLNFLKNYSITYVMVSSDLIPKFGAMSKIANWGKKIDVLPIFNLAKNYQEGGKVLLEYGDPTSQSILVAYSTASDGNTTTLQNITAMIKMPQGQAYIRNIGIGNHVITTNRSNSIPGLLYFAGSAVIYAPEAVQDCVFVRLYLFDGAGMEKYFEKVYDNLGMKIYKVKYENFPANITGQFINAVDRDGLGKGG